MSKSGRPPRGNGAPPRVARQLVQNPVAYHAMARVNSPKSERMRWERANVFSSTKKMNQKKGRKSEKVQKKYNKNQNLIDHHHGNCDARAAHLSASHGGEKFWVIAIVVSKFTTACQNPACNKASSRQEAAHVCCIHIQHRCVI